MSRKRSFVFTLNNPSDTDEQRIQGIAHRYLCYGREVAPTTGTRHLQGYICFDNGKTVSAVRRLLTGCHVEIARGSPTQCRDYCTKDADYFEDGQLPIEPAKKGELEQQRWRDARTNAIAGELDEIPDQIFVQHFNTIRSIAAHYAPESVSLPEVCGVWLFGTSGTGKTEAVRQRFPGAYCKMPNKWWDGYDVRSREHRVVYLDDVDPQHVRWIPHFLKIWGDKHPFRGEAKGTTLNLRPRVFIVTSQYRIEEMGFNPEDCAAIARRYVQIEKIKIGPTFVPLVWPGSRIDNIAFDDPPQEEATPVVEEGPTVDEEEEELSLILDSTLSSINLSD